MTLMGKRFDFEYIVIGGGTTGKTTAINLAKMGQKVALVEQDRWGGNGLNYRDIPYGACLNFSHFYSRIKTSRKMGLVGEIEYSWQTLSKWRDAAILKAGGNDKKELEKAGVTCLKGQAKFLGSYDMVLNEKKKISASKFLIATGSVLNDGGIAKDAGIKYLTPATALRLTTPPEAVMVIGGGSTGCELAQYFAELGAKVVLVEGAKHILPKEDPEVGQVLEQYLSKRLGIKILNNTRVVKIQKDGTGPSVVFVRGGKEKMARVETIVLATGSVPNTANLGLKEARVSFDKKGITVDKTLQTSARNIFAAGDVIGCESSEEIATYLGQLAANNLAGKTKGFVNYDGFIRMTETSPQVASVGISEADLIKRRRKYKKVVVPLSDVKASITADFTVGFVKVMIDGSGKILGGTIVAPRAAEMIQEIAMAVRHGLTAVQVASTPHVAGSWSEAVRVATRKIIMK